ncbi:hypothetical protein BJV74DRAFT_911445 [Russula compacta]|nr:hypothetical protein BJV74DRAFT_911445 [Russula compacta]
MSPYSFAVLPHRILNSNPMPDAPASSTNPSGTGSHPDATFLEDPSDSEGFFCVELFKEKSHSRSLAAVHGLALENANQWENDLQRRVKEIADEWMRYANIKFQFVGGREAETRIKFTGKDGSSRSWVGKDNLLTPPEETMSLGIEETSLEARIRHVVLHEFGHALGFVHEYMQPNFPSHVERACSTRCA